MRKKFSQVSYLRIDVNLKKKNKLIRNFATNSPFKIIDSITNQEKIVNYNNKH